MHRRHLLGLLAGAAMAAVPLAALPAQQRAPVAKAEQDWTRIVARTPEGGYRLGNSQAAVKLVEFVSLTCPACAEFSRAAMPRLKEAHIRSGRVSFELRNFVLNPYDAAAAMLSRCAPAQNYFALSEEYLATQAEWMGRARALGQAKLAEVEALPEQQRLGRIARLIGLDQIAARHGVSADQARACLDDEAGLQRLIELRQAGDALGVRGTPSFLLNGQLIDAHHWAGIEPLLRPPGR
jgi:protein-disulfide isomerase